MKRVVVYAIIAALLVSLVATIALSNRVLSANKTDKFYIGVTFCGDATAQAKLLIDKVAGYTNLFVLQSGPLMGNTTAVNEIGDYAVAKGLHFAAYFDTSSPPQNALWLGTAMQRWGTMFAGVYYGDEPAGKMLDTNVDLTERTFTHISNQTGNTTIFTAQTNVYKLATGELVTDHGTYYPNGTIKVSDYNGYFPDPSFYEQVQNGNKDITFFGNSTTSTTTYYPNGTIEIEETTTKDLYFAGTDLWGGDKVISNPIEIIHNCYTIKNDTEHVAQKESYAELLSKNPIPDCDAAANLFVGLNGKKVGELCSEWQLGNRSFPIFTADYALHWWDYQSGYDMVLAELGWNNSVTQEIGLVRGAANLQNKSWGTIITWKYMQAPYLGNGDEMFDQLRSSYEGGAEYTIVFNYAKDMNGTYGILQAEHFQALERFWRDVVKSPFIGHGSVEADAVLILPNNFGWGMRNPTDSIWGLWNANDISQQIWAILHDKLSAHGSKLDIVYEDTAFPVAVKYKHIYYWNATS